MIASFNQETNISKEDLRIWDQMLEADLDVLITYKVIPSMDIFYEYRGLMGYKPQVVKKHLTKVQGSLQSYQEVEMEIMNDLR